MAKLLGGGTDGRDALDRFEESSRAMALLAAENMERSNITGASECAAALRRAYDSAGAQLAEAQSSSSRGSQALEIGIGTGGRADLSATKSLGNDMLGKGTEQTKFGSGISLGGGFPEQKDSGGRHESSGDQKETPDSRLEQQTTLRGGTGSSTSVPADWLKGGTRLPS
ncbi:hypothetical protein [Herbidospora sp. NBRC 101105]|uniref:hypothetical protein n=1 Tax=Herbidospora sp. NBRC 101105 TaxID=3032195 RepID=UPI0024A1CD9C|nr:hypothetical protein [Herbidospora sp. NBRC 101105]GLX97339.1 hypothetical protein Hesp01_52890 [Herbidospora sp. NBRC 101105]